MARTLNRLAGAVLAVFALVGGLATLTASAAHPTQTNTAQAASPPSSAGVPVVSYPVRSDTSAPLRSIPPIRPQQGQAGEFLFHPIDNARGEGLQGNDPVVQKQIGPLAMPTPSASFEGMFNHWGGYPPDTSGDVGPNHFVQIVNVGFQVFSKTGTSLYGPANNNSLFRGFGGLCETTNSGDPIGLYDPLADRWILSWFAFTSSSGPTHQCIALSATPDPLGVWYRYDFLTGPGLEDYPHMGVWPDAYYMATNTFPGGGSGGNFAFERERMLQGDPTARMVTIRVATSGLLPSDMDGRTPPPAGSPNYYLKWQNSTNLAEYKFHVDWGTPANSTFTGPTLIPVPTFSSGVAGIPQPGTTVTLATLADRLMYRVAYRNMGSYEALVVTHTVNSGGLASIRWYEIRDPNTTPPTLFQAGTFAPADGVHRWMGSVAMDGAGNIAAVYSASSTAVFPSIRYAGRLVSDPINTFSQGEATLIAGTGSQTGTGARWGDYSMMTIDPSDDCTFWFTTEYIQVTGERTWRTRIGSFKFPSCTPTQATPVPTATGPVPSPSVPPATPTACASGATYTGSITAGDLVQTSRLVSVGLPPGTCATPRSCPGNDTSDSTQHRYDSYTYTNTTGASQCVTVKIVQACSNNALISVTYLGSYDPANKCTNYLADGARGGPQNVYSFTLPAGQTAVVIVYEQNGGVGCETYSLSINPVPCPAGGPTATSTATSPVVTLTPTSVPASATATLPVSTSTSTRTNTPVTPSATSTLHPPTQTPGGPSATTEPSNTPVPPTSTSVPSSTSTPCTITFSDVDPDNTFYSFIRCLACRGIISGYDDGTFRPFNDITRGQIAKMVSNAAGFSEDPGPQVYEDTPPASPFYQWINRLSNRGHMGGYPCGLLPDEPCIEPDNLPYFRPSNSATRGQLSKIVANAADLDSTPSGQFYTDVDESHPFYLWIMRLTELGVMSGYECGGEGEPCDSENRPYFRPYNNVTRGQASKIVANTFFPDCQTPTRQR